jgi:hypothetical protein
MEKEEQKFDHKALMNLEMKIKGIVTRKNEPNLDRMARAFYDLLIRK